MHTCNASTHKAGAGGSLTIQPGLQSLSQKKQKQTKNLKNE